MLLGGMFDIASFTWPLADTKETQGSKVREKAGFCRKFWKSITAVIRARKFFFEKSHKNKQTRKNNNGPTPPPPPRDTLINQEYLGVYLWWFGREKVTDRETNRQTPPFCIEDFYIYCEFTLVK